MENKIFVICECGGEHNLFLLKIAYEMYIQLQFDETKHEFITLSQEFVDSFIIFFKTHLVNIKYSTQARFSERRNKYKKNQ